MICLHGIGALATISLIGKPRKPVTPGLAIYALVVGGLMSAGAYYLYVSAS